MKVAPASGVCRGDRVLGGGPCLAGAASCALCAAAGQSAAVLPRRARPHRQPRMACLGGESPVLTSLPRSGMSPNVFGPGVPSSGMANRLARAESQVAASADYELIEQ